MADAEKLAKGTRVEITDPRHPWVGDQGEIDSPWSDGLWRIRTPTEDFAYTAVRADQFRIMEPTIGQLVDRMHEVIERVSKYEQYSNFAFTITNFSRGGTTQIIVWTGNPNGTTTEGKTPQAALRSMIERLEGMIG